MKTWLWILVWGLLTGTPFTLQAADTASELRDAYRQAQRLMQSGHFKEAVSPAETAYQAGVKLYGKEHKTSAALALNLGVAEMLSGRVRAAREQIRGALETFRILYGNDALELIDPLMRYGQALAAPAGEDDVHTRQNNAAAMAAFERAYALGGQQAENQNVTGRLALDAAISLSRSEDTLRAGLQFAERAHRDLLLARGSSDEQTILAQYWIGRYYVKLGHDDEALDKLLAAARAMAEAGEISPRTARRIHAELVRAYERQGQRDLATEHILAVSRIDAESPFAQKQIAPLYWQPPDWSALERLPSRGSTVVVELGIDAKGLVTTPAIVESAGKACDELVLATVKRWRFVPPLENGETIGIERVRYSFSFNQPREEPQLGTKIRGLRPLRAPADRAPLGDIVRGGMPPPGGG